MAQESEGCVLRSTRGKLCYCIGGAAAAWRSARVRRHVYDAGGCSAAGRCGVMRAAGRAPPAVLAQEPTEWQPRRGPRSAWAARMRMRRRQGVLRRCSPVKGRKRAGIRRGA